MPQSSRGNMFAVVVLASLASLRQASAEVEFPKLSDIMKDGAPVHLRTEVTLNLAAYNLTKVYTTDEIARHSDVRFRTFGLDKDIDILLFGSEGRLIDLGSDPLRCYYEAPPFEPRPGVETKGFQELWAAKRSAVGELGELYYAPLLLWRMAELNPGQVKLSVGVDLATAKEELDGKLDSLDQILGTYVWTVEGPRAEDQAGGWSYDMCFHKIADDSHTDGSRLVLQKMVVYFVDRLKYTIRSKSLAEINVINYRSQMKPSEYWRDLVLPEGRGCKRGIVSNLINSVKIDPAKNYRFWYQASLDIPDENNSNKWVTSAILTGDILRSGKNHLNTNLFVDKQETLYKNGTNLKQKLVVDTNNDLRYEIDELTSHCSGPTSAQDANWIMKFPLDSNKQIVLALSEESEMKFTDHQGNAILHAFRKDGYEYAVYERSFDELFLPVDGVKSLDGPVIITSTFTTPIKCLSGFACTMSHQSVHYTVRVFNEDRTKLRGRLSLELRGLENIDTIEFVGHLDVSRCDMQQVRHFTMEYSGVRDTRYSSSFHDFNPREQFTVALMKEDEILPTQVVGRPTIWLEQNGEVRFEFSLIEPPTAINFGPTMFSKSRMNKRLEYRSEMVLSHSLVDCSKRCDRIGCVAMSYCQDHSCRLLDKRMLCQGQGETCKLEDELAKLAKTRVRDSECSLYYWSRSRTASLDSFVSSMSSRIQMNPKSLNKFILSIKIPYTETIAPLKISEPKRNLLSADSEKNIDADHFRTIYSLRAITVDKLQDLATKAKRKFSFSQLTAASLASCLTIAGSRHELVSYCKSNGLCLMLEDFLNNHDLSQVISSEEQTSCSILMRDTLLSYHRFEGVKEPETQDLLLNDVTANQCALTCDHQVNGQSSPAANFTCFSFDFCRDRNGDQELGTCHLQKSHIATSDFDRSTFEPYWRTTGSRTASSCDHYSKSVLADFRHLPRKKLSSSDDKMAERLAVGSTAEACAISCLEDELCPAFEYCLDYQSRGTQSCYIMHYALNLDPYEMIRTGPEDFIEGKLEHSETCSLYVLTRKQDPLNDMRVRNSMVIVGVPYRLSFTTRVACYVLAALISGILIRASLTYLACRRNLKDKTKAQTK